MFHCVLSTNFLKQKYSTGFLVNVKYIRCQMTERCRGCPLAREGEEQQEQEILLKPADRLALRLIAPEKGCRCLSRNDAICSKYCLQYPRDIQRLPTNLSPSVLRKEYFDCPERDSYSVPVNYILQRGQRGKCVHWYCLGCSKVAQLLLYNADSPFVMLPVYFSKSNVCYVLTRNFCGFHSKLSSVPMFSQNVTGCSWQYCGSVTFWCTFTSVFKDKKS